MSAAEPAASVGLVAQAATGHKERLERGLEQEVASLEPVATEVLLDSGRALGHRKEGKVADSTLEEELVPAAASAQWVLAARRTKLRMHLDQELARVA